MIEIESRELADIPVLHAYPVGQKDTPLPCVIFYHGFTSSSLVYSYSVCDFLSRLYFVQSGV